MVTCDAYRDAWQGFFTLLEAFWPNHPQVTIVTDKERKHPHDAELIDIYNQSWTGIMAKFADTCAESFLMLQEDMWLDAPVREDMIRYGLRQLVDQDAGCVRLFPMPGADGDYGDPYFGSVLKSTSDEFDHRYRISCQAAWWKPAFIAEIARNSELTAGDFEKIGSIYSNQLPEPVLAWKRDIEPWPIHYINGLSRGIWTADAMVLSDRHHLNMDWTQRGFLH